MVVGGQTQLTGADRDRIASGARHGGSLRRDGGRTRVRNWARATEVVLGSRNITCGVVRVGETVRRPHSDASRFTESLLRHLQAVGFSGAPLWLGVDDQGRDTLSYLPGRVGAVDQRLCDAQVTAAGRLLRSFHDATRGYALAGTEETVCHHDAGPYNMVFGEDGLPYALIDFDHASPDNALKDVGYAAWVCCINSQWLQQAPVVEQARQLRLFADSYGLERNRRCHVVSAVISCQLDTIRWADRSLAERNLSDPVRQHAARLLVGCKREHAFTLTNRAGFDSALP